MTVAPATPAQKRQLWAILLTAGFLSVAALQLFLISLRVSGNFSFGRHPIATAWFALNVPYTLLAGAAVVLALYTRIAGGSTAGVWTHRLLKLSLCGTAISMILGYFMKRETQYIGGHMVPLDLFFDSVQALFIPAVTGIYCASWLVALRRERRG